MYVLVVKTSFDVWRLNFMSPDFMVVRQIVLPWAFACLSVCLSVTKSCQVCNLKTVKEILMERHRNRLYAERKNHNYWIYSFELCPFELL